VLTNTMLEDLIATLESDRRIPESSEMAVSADGGNVTLRGSVESFCQRRAAARDARESDGVYEVDEQLKLSFLGDERRDDDGLGAVAPQNVMWATDASADFVDVKVACVGRPGARRPTPSARGQAPARNSTATSSLRREGANR
jgi:hypothetical protein